MVCGEKWVWMKSKISKLSVLLMQVLEMWRYHFLPIQLRYRYLGSGIVDTNTDTDTSIYKGVKTLK